MKKVFGWPKLLKKVPYHFCPGCGHSILHRLIAEILEEDELAERAIMVAPVGCAVLAYNYLNIDVTEAPHGRCAAVATGIKRALPDALVFTYQGDGDLAAIGTAETIHAAGRGENVTTVYINNAVFGMTGGQMAPTTIVDQVTTTTPRGRAVEREGFPLDMSMLLAQIKGVCYLERLALYDAAGVRKIKRAIRKAFTYQLENQGFSLVEVLSPCPTNWKVSAGDALQWVKDVMTKEYPPGVLVDRKSGKK